MRRSFRLVCLSLSAGLALCMPSRGASAIVVDGGTLTVDGRTFGLWGIEAPTAGRTCRTAAGAEWACGDRAREELAAVVADTDVECEAKGEGVALCRAAGLDLGLLLVKEGLAWSRGGYDEIEGQAREARVGIWE